MSGTEAPRYRVAMCSAALASVVHLWGLAIGFYGITLRARRLGEPLDEAGLKRVLAADNWWGIASILWIGSGLMRLLYLEKSRDFYLRNGFFWLKMGLFLVVMCLELWPMIVFIKWRVELQQGKTPDTSRAPTFRLISRVEQGVILAMVIAAALMARAAWLF